MTTVRELVLGIHSEHEFQDDGCSCGWSSYSDITTSWKQHTDEAIFVAGRTSAIVAILDSLNNYVTAFDEVPAPDPVEPTGIGATVRINMDGHFFFVVHAGFGKWYSDTGVSYVWADILGHSEFEIVSEGQSVEDVSPRS